MGGHLTLAVVTAASLLVALLTSDPRWRPIALGGVFFLRIGVPSVVGDITSGGLPAPHVSTVLILSFAAVWFLMPQRNHADRTSVTARIPPLSYVAVIMVSAGTVLMSGSSSAGGFVTGFVLNQIVAPYLFCVLLVKTLNTDSLYKDAGRLFALFAASMSVVAIAVNYGLIPQPYLSAYPLASLSLSLDGRQMATLDHPLILGLFLAAGIPMATYFQHRATTYISIILMMIGISFTQSRIAVVGALCGIAYLMVVGSRTIRQRISIILTAVVGYAILEQAGFLQGLFDRIQYDEGSTSARRQAVELFVENWSNFKVYGVGMQQNKEYFQSQGLRSSGESAAISYAVGIGIPLALLYMSLIAWMIFWGIRQSRRLSSASAAAIIVFGSCQFFSSISTESAASIILWTSIGIALSAPRSANNAPSRYQIATPRVRDRGMACDQRARII